MSHVLQKVSNLTTDDTLNRGNDSSGLCPELSETDRHKPGKANALILWSLKKKKTFKELVYLRHANL